MAIVKKYSAEVVSFEQPIKDIFTIRMRSLSGIFKYSPGQFLHLALDEYDPSSGWPESRCFSMRSAFNEELIKITFAVKGSFTKLMAANLHIGCKVALKLPYGDLFTQEHTRQNVVFIAGGTGITPFLSLFKDDLFRSYFEPVLFAGFKEQKFNLYNEEISIAKQINKDFEVNFIYQDQSGILSIAEILKRNGLSRTYFISGPPLMIKSFKNYLTQKHVSASNIKSDDWE